MKVVDALTEAIRSAAVFNPDVQSAPSCILWSDGDRQWEAVIPRLQADMPELFVLGDYRPERRIGPAIWLRCAIAGKVDGITIPADSMPILYLPGASRQNLRAVETCPEHLKPLAELQYRGTIWSQVNAKDWTILAFLKSDQGGLGLDVAQDNVAKKAMQLALYRLLDEDVELLRGKRLDKDDFNTLLSGGDPIRDLLTWLDQGDGFRGTRDANAWRGFVEVLKSQLAFDLENDGALKAAQLLAEHIGPWQAVWDRYCEAPRRYPNIPAQLRKTRMPADMFADKMSWPQWNEGQEGELQQSLLATKQLPPHQARKSLGQLEERHSARRKSVWAELGEAPLAAASEHLAHMAEATGHNLAAGDASDMVGAYRSTGWRADDSVVRALACVHKPEDVSAVEAAIQAVYLPWSDDAARHLQKLSTVDGYPGGDAAKRKCPSKRSGECILFVDGLRFDVAERLAALLVEHGCIVEAEHAWAALPSVTATAKPAVSPVADKIAGKDVSADFEPSVAATGQSLKGGYHLRKLLLTLAWVGEHKHC